MTSILLHLAAALCYALVAVGGWCHCRVSDPQSCPPRWLRPAYVAALLVHGAAVWAILFGGVTSGIRLGVAPVLSLTLWLAGVILAWDLRRPEGHWTTLIHAPAAAAVAIVAAILPLSLNPVVAAGRPALVAHLLVAVVSYALFSVVAIHAFLMTLAEQALHHHRFFRWLEHLPPLMTMERQLFRMIWMGFAALTLTNLTGIVFSEALFGVPWRWDHKTVFSLSAWLVFAVLLFGRWRYGWRGQTALRWLWGGIVLLALAYLGFHFVRDFLLTHRSA